MKPAGCSSRPRARGPPTARANSAAPSGSNSWARARPRSSNAAGRSERAAMLLLIPSSSSAKADDPVRRGVSIPMQSVDYWIPAFAGMTSVVFASALVGPHPLQHLLDMRDRSFRLDAVAEVEDQPALCVVRKHVIDRLIECGAAGDQRQGIEIALDGDAVLHAFADQ